MTDTATRGAWVFGSYRFIPLHRMGAASGTIDDLRVNRACAAIQRRLITLGYDPRRVDGVFGWRTKLAVLQFQREHDVRSRFSGRKIRDGEVGSSTMGELFRARLKKAPEQDGCPVDLPVGIIIHETGFDPAAVGASTPPELGTDRGWVQINSLSHPEVSDSQAYDAVFSLNWIVNRLLNFHTRYAPHVPDEQAWDASVLSNLSPVAADAWAFTGEQPTDVQLKFVEDVKAYGGAFWADS